VKVVIPMTEVRDRVQLTSPGPVSPTTWGRSAYKVNLASGSWVASLHGATAEEALEPQAAVSEFDYAGVAFPRPWQLKRSNDGWIASDRPTGIFGFGQDRNEAISDLIKALHEHRDVLERQEALSPGLQDQLTYLNAIL
jgi:hypothetical protein